MNTHDVLSGASILSGAALGASLFTYWHRGDYTMAILCVAMLVVLLVVRAIEAYLYARLDERDRD